MPGNEPVDDDRIQRARAAGAGVVKRTPILTSATIGNRVGGTVVLKAENLQRTGAFKIRGAMAKLSELGREASFRELHCGDRPDGRDELIAGNVRASCLQFRYRVGNRKDMFEWRMPAGSIADKNNVIVRIDDAGDHRLPLQVHGPNVGRRGGCIPHFSKSAIANDNLGNDAVGCIHRMDPAVDEGDREAG